MAEKRFIDAFDLAETIENMTITVAGKPARWNDAKCSVLREIAQAPDVDVIEIPKTGIGDLSDGYHTFNELYHHRAVLFSVICNSNPQMAWKSKLHDTGDMFDGMFIVGIETPQGQATYHYDINPYWDMFKVEELTYAPKWDGHTPEEAIRRISTLLIDNSMKPIEKFPFDVCPVCDTVVLEHMKHCTQCGQKLDWSDKE